MMTPQESQALREFLAQLTQVQGVQKDAQAASMIGAAFAQQPDAGYLLVQRSMLQDQAVANARNQIAQLQAQLQAERESSGRGASNNNSSGGFLDPANAWGNSAADLGRGANAVGGRALQGQRYEGSAAPQNMPAQAQQYAQAPVQRPGLFGGGGGLFGGGGGGGSFLGSMAATAAGVAGGAFLFQGIENMMGHHGGGASGLMGQNGAVPVENTTVNNYYGADTESAGSERTQLADNSIDTGGADDFSSSDDLGSSDDMSSI